MTLRQSIQIAQKLPTISADGYEPILIVGDYVTTAALVAGDVLELCVLPGGYVTTNMKIAMEDLDSSGAPTTVFDAGFITGTPGVLDNSRTCGNQAIGASAVGQTGGIAIDNNALFSLTAPLQTDRSVGMVLSAGSATLIVGARIRMTVTARPQLNGA